MRDFKKGDITLFLRKMDLELEMLPHLKTSLNSLSVRKLLDFSCPYFACICFS